MEINLNMPSISDGAVRVHRILKVQQRKLLAVETTLIHDV
jgi:hypothetical protein